MIKLIALDLDGTLLRTDQTISKITRDKLHECETKGIEWMLVTGRNYDIVKPIMDDYGLACGMILNSGHEYVDENGVQRQCIWMKDDTVRYILKILLDYDYHISVHTDRGKYIFMDKEAYYADHMELSRQKWGSDLTDLMDCVLYHKEKFMFNTHQVSSVDELLSSGVHVLKIDARNFCEDKVQKSLPMIRDRKNIAIHSSYGAFIEISDTAGNKASMLEDVIRKKGIQKDQVAVFGDSMNDLELFEQFTYSFAMENASDDIKRNARWITDTNDNDGVAKGIDRILKENL